MKPLNTTSRVRRTLFADPVPPPLDSAAWLEQKILGQPDAIRTIVPAIRMFQAGLAPEDRPAGVFLLLGPTGSGKTRTAEAIADFLHGTPKNLLRIDCGEYQLDHEVAKLIGAPPGYLGHRETQALLSQQRLNAIASEKSSLTVVLFDEIEKAAPSLQRLLLGVLDKGTLRLGDNSVVSFDRSLIFMTSNLGAANMAKALTPQFGFEAFTGGLPAPELDQRLHQIGTNAVKRRFPPEFVNRIDAIISYRPLDPEALQGILDLQLSELQAHINKRLGANAFRLAFTRSAKQMLLRLGTSAQFGARELKRTILTQVTQPLATLVSSGRIEAGARVVIEVAPGGDALRITPQNPNAEAA
jgi:ATP-dependent Clp protease ATP-binding subunit ClpA